MTGALIAHLGCALLVGIDLISRSMRLRLLTVGAGHPLRFSDAFVTNLLTDAGAAISPMRLAGEPARIAAMRHAGVPMATVLRTIAWELVTAWPTLLIMGSVLISCYAPEWWQTAAPLLGPLRQYGMPALIVVGIGTLITFLIVRRRRRGGPARNPDRTPVGRSWRQMPMRSLWGSIPLTMLNVATRTAMLPMLASTLPNPPSAATLWVGSFILVYGQLFFPTPAGIGAVELAFLGGAAGGLENGVGLLLAWRWWGTGLPLLLGIIAAVRIRRGYPRGWNFLWTLRK